MAEVEIYTTPLCPYCWRAKSLLGRKGIAFIEIDLWRQPERRPEMVERAGGRTTVPQIFVDGRSLGGSDELAALDARGRARPESGDAGVIPPAPLREPTQNPTVGTASYGPASPMILFDLRCKDGHGFEAWFRDSAAYEEQVAANDIACPVCGATEVSKALMAPAVWRKVQNHIEKNFDHVGPQFADEARKIHYGETEKRSIYGEATKTEAKELKDEGIDVNQIPWLPRHDG
jgi:GrxC family glutaredoxin